MVALTLSVCCIQHVKPCSRNARALLLESWPGQTKTTRGTGVFTLLDCVSETLCLLHYVPETSHLYSLRYFWRHFGLIRAAAHSDRYFFASCINTLTYLVTYTMLAVRVAVVVVAVMFTAYSYSLITRTMPSDKHNVTLCLSVCLSHLFSNVDSVRSFSVTVIECAMHT